MTYHPLLQRLNTDEAVVENEIEDLKENVKNLSEEISDLEHAQSELEDAEDEIRDLESLLFHAEIIISEYEKMAMNPEIRKKVDFFKKRWEQLK